MNESGVLPTFEADGTDFGQTMMVDHPCSPAGLDLLSGRRDTTSGFACDDQHVDRAISQPTVSAIELTRDLDKSERIGWRAAHDSRLQVVNELQTHLTRHPACRNAVGTELSPGVKRGPEAEKRSKRERK